MNEHSQTQNEQKDWKKQKGVESYEEESILKLDDAELEKCRYMIVDPQRGIAECYYHRKKLSHGVVLFPKHLFNLKAGRLFYKKDRESEWQPFKPNLLENVKKLVESQRI